MRFNIFRTAAVLLLLFTLKTFGQNTTLYDLYGPNSMEINPAHKLRDRSTYFTLPVLNYTDFQFTTGRLNYNDITSTEDGKTVVDTEKIHRKLDRKNTIGLFTEIGLLGVGIKNNKDYYSIQIKEKALGHIRFGNGVTDLILNGTSTVDINGVVSRFNNINTGEIDLNMLHYREIALGYDRIINDKFTIGIRGKILFGMAGIETNGVSLRTQSKDLSSIEIYTAGQINVSAPIDFTMATDSNGDEYIEDLDTNFDQDYFSNFDNLGFGLDIGIEYQHNEEWLFGLSVIDLGVIGFKNNTQIYQQSHYSFKGVDISNSVNDNQPGYKELEDQSDALMDEIEQAFRIKKKADKFNMTLPTKIYITSSYTPEKWFTAGFLSKYESFNDFSETLVQLSGTIRSNVFELTSNYSWSNTSGSQVGLGLSVKAGIVHFYAATDNIIAYSNPKNGSFASIRLGLNFILD
ncbi:DUF5723 family protein [Halosquirtibacter xylanolyticus]|uniref:DUF5723 family protein n=1 Tax=Halosquirtibacter xylanolyticus TaxID=3374599 RepID=UPI0037483586|nr:DUF5723 family protein [Prolixibacteraceae bacterium]